MFGIGLALKLLGIGSSIKDFLFKHWKLTLAVILVLGLTFYHFKAVDTAYNNGVVAEQKRNEAIVKKIKDENKKIEDGLNKTIASIEEKNKKLESKRKEKELVYKDKIIKIIESNPIYQECKVDQSLSDNRNEIRRGFK